MYLSLHKQQNLSVGHQEGGKEKIFCSSDSNDAWTGPEIDPSGIFLCFAPLMSFSS